MADIVRRDMLAPLDRPPSLGNALPDEQATRAGATIPPQPGTQLPPHIDEIGGDALGHRHSGHESLQ
jgi:hypothetical protein